MLDSLVRVTRRVDEYHFVQDRFCTDDRRTQTIADAHMESIALHTRRHRDARDHAERRTDTSSVESEPSAAVYNRGCPPTFLPPLLTPIQPILTRSTAETANRTSQQYSLTVKNNEHCSRRLTAHAAKPTLVFSASSLTVSRTFNTHF